MLSFEHDRLVVVLVKVSIKYVHADQVVFGRGFLAGQLQRRVGRPENVNEYNYCNQIDKISNTLNKI